MPTGAWRRRHPLPVPPGMIRVQPIGECTPAEAEAYRAGRTERDRSNKMVHVDENKLHEMAHGIDELIEHHHEYDELDEAWLVETARRLREMTASGAVATAVNRIRAYLDAHASSHRNPDVIANLVLDKPNGCVIELRVSDLRALLDGVDDRRPPRSSKEPVFDSLRRPGAFGGPPL